MASRWSISHSVPFSGPVWPSLCCLFVCFSIFPFRTIQTSLETLDIWKMGMLAIKDWSWDAAGLDKWDMGVWVPPAPPGQPHSCPASSWPLLAFELVPCLLTSDPNLCCSPIQILPWPLCHSCRKPPREAPQHCLVLSRSGASPTHHLFLYCLQAKDECEIFK